MVLEPHHEGRHAGPLGTGQALDVVAIRADGHHFGAVRRVRAGVQERLQVGASAGDEHDEACGGGGHGRSLDEGRTWALGRLRGINNKLKIGLGILGGIALLCAVAGVLLALKAAKDRANDSPSEVDPGSEFEHDGFTADEGWQVVEERGDFDIVDLTLENRQFRERSAYLQFTIYRDGEVIAYISCSRALGPRESATADCFSADEYEDFDEVRVADTF